MLDTFAHRSGTIRIHFMQPQIRSLISDELRQRFARASNVLVMTGAGVSAESGVPTFRGGGNTTVWKGLPFEIISSAGMLERDLPAVWEWFNYRRGLLASLKPNPAHEAIARWQTLFGDLTLVTQNIDGLHQAGRVAQCHRAAWQHLAGALL